MGNVIGLAGVLQARSAPSYRRAALGPVPPSFTIRDRRELDMWSGVGRRAVIISCEIGNFAMLYDHGNSWASWGVVRQPRGILLWNCVSHADVDRFESVFDAIGTIDGLDAFGTRTSECMPLSVENVVSLMAHRDARTRHRMAR